MANNYSFSNLDNSLNIARNYLNIWAQSINNSNLLAKAFGNRFERNVGKTLIQNWRESNFTEFPNVEIVSASEIDNAKGAYAKDSKTIYLAQELLDEADNESIAAVILEEYGHHLDTLLNQIDTLGDEGAIFSALVRGKELTPEQLQTIKVEDDNTVVHLNGQPVRIEQAASFPASRSGSSESVRIVLDAGGNKGTINLSFETYTVPDRIQLFYEGGTLYDSGFVGKNDTVTKTFDGDSSLVTVQMTPNIPNPGGTAWYFSVNAEVEECPETGDLSLKPENGEFEPGDTEGVCEASGTINVGRSDAGATSELISVNGMNPRHDKDKFEVENGLVYALINPNISEPLFKTDGTLALSFDGTGSFVEDSSNDFTLAGLEVDFEKIKLGKNEIVLEGGFSLPNAVGGLNLDLNAPNALIISSSNVRVDGGNISFPDEEFKLFDAFNVTSESASIEYSPVDDELKIQGKLALVTPFFKGKPSEDGATISLDLSGENYIRIVNGQAEFSGEFALGNVSLTEKLKINELALAITIENSAITALEGTADVVLPWSLDPLSSDGTGAVIEAGFVFPSSGIELDKIRIEGNDLDLLVGNTGVYVQKIEGGFNNIAPSNSEDVEFKALLGLTYGPELTFSLDNNFFISGEYTGAAVNLDIDAAVSDSSLTGGTNLTIIDSNVFEFRGSTEFSWEEEKESLTITGGFSAFAGIFQTPNFSDSGGNSGDAKIEFDFAKKTVTAAAGVALTFPNTPLFEDFKDSEFFSANGVLNYSDDGDDTNDYIAGWGKLTVDSTSDENDIGIDDIELFNFNLLKGARFFLDENRSFEFFEGEVPEDITKDFPNLSAQQIPALDSLSTNQNNSTKPDNNDYSLTANESLSSSDIAQFEETVEASGEESRLLLGVHWDNLTNPKEIPLKLLTPNGIIEEADFSNYPNIGAGITKGDNNSKYIVVKDPEPGIWGATVSDSNQTELGEVRVHIDRLFPNVEPTLEILDISQSVDGSEVTITYEALDPDNETTFDLYYTSEQDGNFFPNAQSIASDLPEQDGVGTYTWNTEGVKPGEYYIYGIIKDQFDLPRINSNYSTQTVEITNQADLSVNLSANVAREAIVGENITYTATVTNNSDDVEDKDVNLYINIPRDFELVSTSVPATSTEGRRQEGLGDIELNLGQLAPGASQTVEIVLDPADTSEIYGRTWATVTGAAYDPNADNSQDDVFIDIVELPVLKPFLVLDRIDRNESGEVIEPDPSRIEIQRDEPYTYEIAVTNTGDATATGVVVTENIFDLAAELNEVTLTQGDYDYDSQTGEITANFGSIAPGETETVGITITPSKAIKTSSTSTIQYNEKIGTNEITTQTKIKLPPIEPADLELSQTVNNPIPSLGEEIIITLNLFNQGPGVAGQVEIRNLLPEGLTFVSANAGFGSYDSATGIWSAGNIANGAGTSLTITAKVEDIGNFTNQAEVISTGQADPDSTPNNGDPDEDDFSSLTIRNANIDTDEDTSVTILASELLDSYVGNNPQITEITVSTDGTAIINADGNVEFTPNPNFNGIASFDYNITDGENTNTASTNIYVRPVNDPLIANDDNFTTDEDISPTILASELFINDVNNDIEKELNISSVENAANGTASLNGEGDIEFFLDANFNGTASFDYTVTDGNDIETASVEVEVNAVNDIPVANDDTFTIDEDTPLTILATELLSNDTDVETPENLSVTEVKSAVNATATMNEDGDIEFIPNANFNGTASFDYTVTDGDDSETASVEVTVNAVNDPLVANDDTFTIDEDTSLSISSSELFDNDVNNDIEKSLSVTQVSNSIGAQPL